MRISTAIVVLATLLLETSANALVASNASLVASHVECENTFPIPNMCGLVTSDCLRGCTCSINGIIIKCTPPNGGCTSSDVIQQCQTVAGCYCFPDNDASQ